jgi:multidrug resistance protein MdtO
MNATLRITLASVLTLLVLMSLRIPFANLSLYFVFLVGRDSPAVSIRSSLLSLLTLMAAVALELAVVILTDNDPMARVVSVGVVVFLAGVLLLASSLSALASVWGFIFCTLIATWEEHVPANALVEGSLWLIAAVSVGMGFAVAVEYIFGSRHPADEIQEQRRIRYQALEAMFRAYAQAASEREFQEATIRVGRLAVLGQAGMQELYNKLVDRNMDVGFLPVATRVRITMLAQLMDYAAAFGLQNPAAHPELRQRCVLLAELCRKLRLGITPTPDEVAELCARPESTLLGRVEATLRTILAMPSWGTGGLTRTAAIRDKEMVALPARKVPFLRPGALNKETVAFALKLSLCATVCYVFYHAVDWPGISTSVTTVLITGLSSSGAIKQKLIFRVLGSLIGGLIFGLGAIAFLFPRMDSITSLVVLVAVVAFMSAWCAGGRRFNYVGLQIAFSFYLVAFQGFRASTELAPARDRFIGILVALVVMAFVFDQIWPVRTVTAMRHSLASVLRGEAALFRLVETGDSYASQRAELYRKADALRDYIGKTIAGLRTMSEAVDYEFGVNRQEHARSSEMIIEAALSAAALFWNQLAFLHKEQDQDFIKEPALAAMRAKLAADLDEISQKMVQKATFPITPAGEFVDPALLANPEYGEYARNSVERYEELQGILAGLSYQA